MSSDIVFNIPKPTRRESCLLDVGAVFNLTSTNSMAKAEEAEEVQLGCSRMEDILRLRDSGEAGLGVNEKMIPAGAESDLRCCHDLGFVGDAGSRLKLSREPDFL